MDPDNDAALYGSNKQYVALRSDLSAALSAFDRAQDWAVRIHQLLAAKLRFLSCLRESAQSDSVLTECVLSITNAYFILLTRLMHRILSMICKG